MPPGNMTSISVEPAARDALRTYAARLGGVLGQRVNQTEALLIAIAMATGSLPDSLAVARRLGIVPDDGPTESIGETQ